MTDIAIPTTLNAEEWKIVMALRDIPDSPVRTKVSGLLAELVRFIQQPRCLGMQSDGFPCGTPTSSCEECQHMLQVLDDLAARVPVQD
jgi:hypothetical protein